MIEKTLSVIPPRNALSSLTEEKMAPQNDERHTFKGYLEKVLEKKASSEGIKKKMEPDKEILVKNSVRPKVKADRKQKEFELEKKDVSGKERNKENNDSRMVLNGMASPESANKTPNSEASLDRPEKNLTASPEARTKNSGESARSAPVSAPYGISDAQVSEFIQAMDEDLTVTAIDEALLAEMLLRSEETGMDPAELENEARLGVRAVASFGRDANETFTTAENVGVQNLTMSGQTDPLAYAEGAGSTGAEFILAPATASSAATLKSRLDQETGIPLTPANRLNINPDLNASTDIDILSAHAGPALALQAAAPQPAAPQPVTDPSGLLGVGPSTFFEGAEGVAIDPKILETLRREHDANRMNELSKGNHQTADFGQPVPGAAREKATGDQGSASEFSREESGFGEPSRDQTSMDLAPAHLKPAFENQLVGAVGSAHVKDTSTPSAGDTDPNVNEVLNQAKYLVTQGGGEVTVKMTPEGMGEVHLKVMLENGKMNIELNTHDKQIEKILHESLSELKSSLASQQIRVEHVTLNKVASPQDTGAESGAKFQNQGDSGQQARQWQSEFSQRHDERRQSRHAHGVNDAVVDQAKHASVKAQRGAGQRVYQANKAQGLNAVA